MCWLIQIYSFVVLILYQKSLPLPYVRYTKSNPHSYNMSRIRGEYTKSEILVMKSVHARGFRFRLHNNKLPGSPDIDFPKYGGAIMVNGCFRHGHKDCRYTAKPKTNVAFLDAKIARNRYRDEVAETHFFAL